MLKQPKLSDDLFEKSSMSFGEHLEELRKALVKAALWLALGTAIGLLFANSVVEFISKPLRAELDVFYLKQAAAKFKSINSQEPPPELIKWMSQNSVMPERVFIDMEQFAGKLGSKSGGMPPGANSSESAAVESKTTPETETITETVKDAKTEPPPKSASQSASQPADYNAVWKNLSAASVGRLEPLLIMRPIPNRLSTFDALEGFLIWLKAGLLVGATIASPGIFWHIWAFMAAGLYPHERRYVYLYLPLSVLLFVSGVSLAFFVIFELVINFLLTYNEGMDIDFAPRLKDYISFALFLPLGFGIAFQLPIVMLALNRFGIITTEIYISKWRIAVLAIAFLSMILTPADAYSMVGMFIPLTLLYFLGILLCKYMPKGPGVGSQAFDPS
ncbi:MAG: twin-arginine translocase subunit TatC [Pirellulaceae bacterium]|nr:twin-arginine translocase subunit TatC [Pirellulaceae bacterium]